MEELNQTLFLKLNSLIGINHLLDLGINISGEYLVFLFVLVEIVLYFIVKKRDIAILAFLSSMLALTFNQIAGFIYFHNRPFMDGLGKIIVNHVPENSFPSDHTTFMFAIALVLYTKLENKIIGEVLLFLALISGLSRVVIGVHYPMDIVGSIFIAIISCLVIYKLEKRLQFFNNFIFKLEKVILRVKNL
jgi:undecaprenyl-diphosphatase